MFKKVVFLLVIILFFFPQIVEAFSVSPLKYTLTIGAGEEKKLGVQIFNSNQEKRIYRLSVLGIEQNDEGQAVLLPEGSAAANWVKSEVEQAELLPGERKTVNYLVKIPGSVYPGFYYLGLAIQEVGTGNGLNLSTQLVTLLSLQVAGKAMEKLLIEQWFSEDNIYQKAQDWQFRLAFINKGNVDLPVVGQIQIKNSSNQVLGKREIKLGNELISQAKRILLPKFNFSEVKVPGRYTIELLIKYGRTNQIITATEKVWYLPLWFLIISTFFLLFILIIVLVLVKLKIKKAIKV